MRGQLKVVTPVSVVICLPLPRRRSLARLYRELALTGPVVCLVNGRPVLPRRRPRNERFWRDSGWHRVPRRIDNITFVILPQGGDRAANKNIIRVVAMLALAIAAPYALGPAGLGLAAGSLGLSAASAAVVIGGGFLLNVLLPPPGAAAGQTAESASPTYNIDAQGNVARLDQEIGKLYGRHMVVGDYAARPWVKYIGQDQFLHVFLGCKLGKQQVHAVRMDRTELWNETEGYTNIIDGVEIQICQPGAPVTLFETGVWTSPDISGIELRKKTTTAPSVTFSGRTLSGIGTGSPVDLGIEVFRTGDEVVISGLTGGPAANNGTRVIQSIDTAAQTITFTGSNFAYQGAAADCGLALSLTMVEIGPYPVCPPGAVVNRFELDTVFPRGLGAYDNDGNLQNFSVTVQYWSRRIDDDGNPLTAFALAALEIFVAKTSTPQRKTLMVSPPLGRYEVKGFITTESQNNPKILNEVQWTGLRGNIPVSNVYSDETTVAVKMRASGQLSAQSSRMLNVIQTAMIPILTDETKAIRPQSGMYVSAGNVLQFERNQQWSVVAHVQRETVGATVQHVIHANLDSAAGTYRGYSFSIFGGKPLVSLISNDSSSNSLLVTGSINISDGLRHAVGYSYDGSSTAAGIKIYVDGVEDKNVTVLNNNLSATIVSTRPFLIGNREDNLWFDGSIGYFRMSNIARPASYFAQMIPAVDANTILSYDFNEGTGLTTDDASANNYTGTLSSALMWSNLPEWSAPFPTRSIAWALADIARKIDPPWSGDLKAAQFAIGRSVSAGSVLHYDRTQAFSGFANIQTDNPNGIIHSNLDSGAGTYKGYQFGLFETGVLHLILVGNQQLFVKGSKVVADGRRHTVGYSYDGSSTAAGIKLYVDGVQDTGVVVLANALASSIVNARPFLIGNRDDNATYFHGKIGYFRLSNIARPGSYFLQQVPAVDANTVLAYDFLEGTGTTVNDLSANNFDGTLTSSVMWSAFVAPITHGAQLPESRIDKAELLSLDAVWSDRGDTFDGIFDQSRTCWDALKAVAEVGRAQPVMVGGTLSFVRDSLSGFARGVFTTDNIRRGTFKDRGVLYNDSTPDDFMISYTDDITWRTKEVRATIPGSTSHVPVNAAAFGITDRTKAWQWGMWRAADNLYRRRIAEFNTDMEGKLILKGQPILVSHDVPRWGSAGRLVAFDRSARMLTFDEPVDWSFGGQYYVSLAKLNNEEWGPVKVTQGASEEIAVMDAVDFAAVEAAMTAIPFVNFDGNGEQIRFTAGPSTKYAKRMKLVSSNPSAIDNVGIVAVIDDPRVFDYENASPP